MPPQTRSRQSTSKQMSDSSSPMANVPDSSRDPVDDEASNHDDHDDNENDENDNDDDDGDDDADTHSSSDLPTPSLTSHALRLSYTIGPGETGVLTFEPYKSLLLPLWRFRTVPIAQHSSSALLAAFTHFIAVGDFVGADMTRKFLQMGMTRAGRYANYAGGRKYAANGEQKARSEGHAGREEKAKVKEIFRKRWDEARTDERYAVLREEWRKEKKAWEKGGKQKTEDGSKVKG